MIAEESDPKEPENLEETEEEIESLLPSIVEVDALPDAEGIPVAALAIFAMRSCGMSKGMIADVLKCHRSLVDYYTRKYDPDRQFSLSPAAIRGVVVAFARSKKIQALAHISTDKLQHSTAAQLAEVALKLQKIEDSIDVPEGEHKSRAAQLIEQWSE